MNHKRTTKSSKSSVLLRAGVFAVAVIGGLVSLIKNLPFDYKVRSAIFLSNIFNSFDDNTIFNTKSNQYFTKGYFSPVSSENSGLEMELISGHIPLDVTGLFMRIGPNQIPNLLSRRYHLFDGHGMIHAVRFTANGGSVDAFYSNQYLKTPKYELESKYSNPIFMMIGELYGKIGLLKVLVLFPVINYLLGLKQVTHGPANTAMLYRKGRLFAMHEGSLPFEFKWEEISKKFISLGFESLSGKLDYPVTAHPKLDSDDGLYFNSYSASDKYPMKYGYANDSLNLNSYFGIDSKALSFAHDFAITDHFSLILESSIHFKFDKLVEGVLFQFNENHKFRIGLLPKQSNSSRDITWYEADRPYGYFHVLNAWEEVTEKGLEVVLWMPLAEGFDGAFKEANPTRMHEIRLNLRSGSMKVERIDNINAVEFTRVHPKFVGKKTKFGFGGKIYYVGFDAHFSGIVKYDTELRRAVSTILLPEGTVISGEYIPIPKDVSNPQSDDVYLGAFVIDTVTNRTEWHLYDGKTMAQEPVARLLSPARVPWGFHAEWVDESQLQTHLKHSGSF